ncbi:hypothetical protein PTSG_08049 [Salpingoeca rosetta]|uniref:Uncharacterized protein n=1 Tax=Salpingoeca rosetta (strain ATCC 50818 / BSB-021) TaxID=946362 RepID=F2UHU9_SALR5|nr:uncharacterized protein PTSG_08049 [Salpingoeca rosetta]EGD76698.1 hypothetical protein PTSG_08049 [Salpingoeca rosetta]|eukprot:XP_004991070.1 hypothetical protein PTSG_08049 [Salpingoeca rosetta]
MSLLCPCAKSGADDYEESVGGRGDVGGPYAASTNTGTADTAVNKAREREAIVVQQPRRQSASEDKDKDDTEREEGASPENRGSATAPSPSPPSAVGDDTQKNTEADTTKDPPAKDTAEADDTTKDTVTSAGIDEETAKALRSMVSTFASPSAVGMDPPPTPPASLRQTLTLLKDRTATFDKASEACSKFIFQQFLWNDDDVETEYGATYVDDDLLGGEHVVVVDEEGNVALRCFHVEPRDKDVLVVSYQWSAIAGTEFEWPGGEAKCTTCRFAGGNRKRGGLNPAILGPGTYWVDHLCCEPMPKGLWSIYKSFYLYNTNERLIVATASALAHNSIHLCNLIAALDQEQLQSAPGTDTVRSITEKLRTAAEHESRGWLVWEEAAASASHVLIINDAHAGDPGDKSDGGHLAVLYTDRAHASDKVVVRPMNMLDAVRPLIGTSAEAKLAKVLAASLLLASTAPASSSSSASSGDKGISAAPSAEKRNGIPRPVLLALTNIVQGIVRAGRMFDVYDICRASSIFGLQQDVIVALLDNTPTHDYLDGNQRTAFPISEHSWMPPLTIVAGTGDEGNGVEADVPCVAIEFPGVPPIHWPLLKLLHVMDGGQSLYTAASIRGLLCAHKTDVPALGCKPFVEAVGVAPDGMLLHLVFFVDVTGGAHMLLPVKLVWELEALDTDGYGTCLTVCTEQWEPVRHAIFPPMPNMAGLCGVLAGQAVPTDREAYVLDYVDRSWRRDEKERNPSSPMVREQWPIAHKWCLDRNMPDEFHTQTPMVA